MPAAMAPDSAARQPICRLRPGGQVLDPGASAGRSPAERRRIPLGLPGWDWRAPHPGGFGAYPASGHRGYGPSAPARDTGSVACRLADVEHARQHDRGNRGRAYGYQ